MKTIAQLNKEVWEEYEKKVSVSIYSTKWI